MAKEVSQEEFKVNIRPELKEAGKTIALCHGVFDLLHYGHIIHLEQAKKMADILVVSITAAKYVRKGPGRPYFDDETRLKVLAALECVDYVILSKEYTVSDVMEVVRPDFYVKGREYAKPEEDITGKINEEKELVEQYGGKLCFTIGQTYSSTKLINTALDGLTDEIRNYLQFFKEKYTMQDIINYANDIEKKKILVIGEVIIDKYTYCNIQGLMTKDTGYSAREYYAEEYMGGAAAIARHLSEFTSDVTLMSIVGNAKENEERFSDELSDKMKLRLFFSNNVPTIVKQRYLSREKKREEYRKIFAVNNIAEKIEYEEEIIKEFADALEKEILEYDAVFLCDFGHGLINQDMMDILQQKARYLVVNCQTNSSNHGLNIITKYTRADAFSLDQQELRLAFPVHANDEVKGLRVLEEHLKGIGWLTRGSQGAYGIEKGTIYQCPAFTLSVKDTIGAGDAFFSIAGLYMTVGAPIEVSTFVGNIAGALEANIVGNKESIEKVNLLKFANTLMNV